MDTYELGTWVDRQLGVRDDRLVTAEELPIERDLERRKFELEYQKHDEKLTQQISEFRDTIEQGISASGAASERFKAQASDIQKKAQLTKRRIHAAGVRLTTLLIVQTLRETGEGIPSPAEAERAIKETYARSILPPELFDTYVAVVAAVLELTDLLSWVDMPEQHILDGPLYQTQPEFDEPDEELLAEDILNGLWSEDSINDSIFDL